MSDESVTVIVKASRDVRRDGSRQITAWGEVARMKRILERDGWAVEILIEKITSGVMVPSIEGGSK